VSKRILAIHAHPDDVEILCGGTVALLAAAGHAVTIVTMTPGDLGSAEMTPETTAQTRRREAANSAAIIGAEYCCAEFRDYNIFSCDSSRRRVTEVLRKAQPDLILTASPVDYMADHEATSELVRDACFSAPIPNYLTGDEDPAPRLQAIPHLYFMDPIGGVDRDDRPVTADVYIDVASTFETKRHMLMEHKSQREWPVWEQAKDSDATKATRTRNLPCWKSCSRIVSTPRGRPESARQSPLRSPIPGRCRVRCGG
jgi:LmbE family N-acetylglucosaminyl deacetylase